MLVGHDKRWLACPVVKGEIPRALLQAFPDRTSNARIGSCQPATLSEEIRERAVIEQILRLDDLSLPEAGNRTSAIVLRVD